MPYPLEKGEFPLLIERWFNEDLDKAEDGDKPFTILGDRVGPKRRLRAIWRYCEIVERLKGAKGNEASIEHVTADNSLIHSSFFPAGDQALDTFQRLMAEQWFGMVPNGAKKWKRQPTSSWTADKSLGQWIGYYGNVELIMVEAMQRALEVSLGLDHMSEVPPGNKQQVEADLRDAAERVWPIYLFLTCPQPWFGAWVTWQCHDPGSTVRGQVTALLQSPGHARPIVPSPVDRKGDHPEVTVGGVKRVNPYFLCGMDQQSATGIPNSGYEGRYLEGTAVKGADPVKATGDQGMWLVTHENHDGAIVWSSFKEPTAANWAPGGIPQEPWELPPIAHYRCATLDQRADGGTKTPSPNKLDGYFDTVVIAPASLDGGIP